MLLWQGRARTSRSEWGGRGWGEGGRLGGSLTYNRVCWAEAQLMQRSRLMGVYSTTVQSAWGQSKREVKTVSCQGSARGLR